MIFWVNSVFQKQRLWQSDTKFRQCLKRRMKKNEDYLSPEALQLLFLSSHMAFYFFERGQEAMEQNLNYSLRTGEFEFSAASNKNELWFIIRWDGLGLNY